MTPENPDKNRLTRDEYLRLEGASDGTNENKDYYGTTKKPRKHIKIPSLNISPKLKEEAKQGLLGSVAIVGSVSYISLPLWLTLGAGLLFVDQKKVKHPEQVFKLPPREKALEIENPPELSRRFAVDSALADKIVCPQSFVRNGGVGLAKPLLPVVRTDVEIPDGQTIITRESATSDTGLGRLVTCSYPESDPKEIMNIPIVREGR